MKVSWLCASSKEFSPEHWLTWLLNPCTQQGTLLLCHSYLKEKTGYIIIFNVIFCPHCDRPQESSLRMTGTTSGWCRPSPSPPSRGTPPSSLLSLVPPSNLARLQGQPSGRATTAETFRYLSSTTGVVTGYLGKFLSSLLTITTIYRSSSMV